MVDPKIPGDGFLVIDDLIHPSIVNKIEDIIFKETRVGLGECIEATCQHPPNHKNIYEQFQFTTAPIMNNERSWSQDLLGIHSLPLLSAISHLGLTPYDSRISRVKINLQTKAYEDVTNRYNTPHVDIVDPNYIVVIYYVNNSDGDTFLFNEPNGTDVNDLTIKAKISPKKGRIIIMNSDILHTGCHPSKNMYRAVINYGYRPN